MTTSGTPGIIIPAASIPPPCSAARYQSDGARRLRPDGVDGALEVEPLVPIGQVPRHDLTDGDGVADGPVLGAEAQRQELGRERAGVMVDPRVDAVRVRLDQPPALGVQGAL